mmetsp:Transcript_67708/g.187105  ORF Transcript_67708/g.187105 Transcript_67708/m.187105 type:complete len:184 (+) Transcript_67708:363-914(+)
MPGGLYGALNMSDLNIKLTNPFQPEEDEFDKFCPKLTRQQRFIGFAVCCCMGYLMSFVGTMCLFDYSASGIKKFTTLYILGNIIALCATGFLVGPKSQCKKMFAKTRRITTVVWLVLLILTLVAALLNWPLPLILVLVVAESMAGVWYAMSYIPFGRKMVISGCQTTCCSPCPQVCEPIARQV